MLRRGEISACGAEVEVRRTSWGVTTVRWSSSLALEAERTSLQLDDTLLLDAHSEDQKVVVQRRGSATLASA